MQYDNTQIVVRERGALEIFDLALHVLRRCFWPLCLAAALGVVPLQLLNHLLIGWMADIDHAVDYPMRFYWHTTILVYIEAPLAMALATRYLGDVVFVDQPRILSAARDTAKSLGKLFWTHGVLRAVIPAVAFAALHERHGDPHGFLDGVAPVGLALYALALRTARPFTAEIVLLEQNPLRSNNPQTITLGKRSGMLHDLRNGDVVVRGLLALIFAVPLFWTLFGACLFASGAFFGVWLPGPIIIEVCFPICLWLVALYMTVVRFLNYLDTRIRQEGWEVELRVRAEAQRLAARLS